MAEHPPPPPDMLSVLNKITETVDNFNLIAVPLSSLYNQWNSVKSSFAMVEASLESRAKKLEADDMRVESMFSEIRVREQKLKLRETEYAERLNILEFNEKFVDDDLVVKEKRILELEEALESKKLMFREELRSFEGKKREIEEQCRNLEAKQKDVMETCVVFEAREKKMREEVEMLESKKLMLSEELRRFVARKREIEEECRNLEAKQKGFMERCVVFEARERKMREEVEMVESKKLMLSEELRRFEARKREIEEKYRNLEAKQKGFMERCVVFEAREKEMREEIEMLESKKTGMMEEFRKLEENKVRVEERCRGLKVKEKEFKERSTVQELKGEELKVLGENLEIKTKEIVEGRRLLEERRKGVEGRKKELDERGKEAELRETNIKERENVLNLKEKELIELERELELKKKNIDKGFQEFSEELRLKTAQVVQSRKELGLKENDFVEKCKQVDLKQKKINEQWKVLEVKEKEINSRLKAVELKEKEMNDIRMTLVNEDVDGTKTVVQNTVGFKDSNSGYSQSSIVVQEEQIGETSRVLRLEKEMNQSGRVADLKGVLKKCTNLPNQADDVLKRHSAEGKLAKDGCNVPGVKEVISDNSQAKNLAVTSVVALSLFSEIKLVFRNDDARATASYLTEHTAMVRMWQENILDLREEITGLLESLIAERKHLQAAMCTCVFKMKDVYPPVFLLNAHLEHVRERAEEIVKEGSGTSQDDAANMELSALRNVLRCISDFKLESIYPPAPHELRITQLEKEMEERRKPKRKSIFDLATELEASKSTDRKKRPTPPTYQLPSQTHIPRVKEKHPPHRQ